MLEHPFLSLSISLGCVLLLWLKGRCGSCGPRRVVEEAKISPSQRRPLPRHSSAQQSPAVADGLVADRCGLAADGSFADGRAWLQALCRPTPDAQAILIPRLRRFALMALLALELMDPSGDGLDALLQELRFLHSLPASASEQQHWTLWLWMRSIRGKLIPPQQSRRSSPAPVQR